MGKGLTYKALSAERNTIQTLFPDSGRAPGLNDAAQIDKGYCLLEPLTPFWVDWQHLASFDLSLGRVDVSGGENSIKRFLQVRLCCTRKKAKTSRF